MRQPLTAGRRACVRGHGRARSLTRGSCWQFGLAPRARHRSQRRPRARRRTAMRYEGTREVGRTRLRRLHGWRPGLAHRGRCCAPRLKMVSTSATASATPRAVRRTVRRRFPDRDDCEDEQGDREDRQGDGKLVKGIDCRLCLAQLVRVQQDDLTVDPFCIHVGEQVDAGFLEGGLNLVDHRTEVHDHLTVLVSMLPGPSPWSTATTWVWAASVGLLPERCELVRLHESKRDLMDKALHGVRDGGRGQPCLRGKRLGQPRVQIDAGDE